MSTVNRILPPGDRSGFAENSFQQHIYRIPRIPFGGRSTCVTVSFRTRAGVSFRRVLELFQESVEEWISETPAGKELYRYSGGDLNIGDLGAYGLEPFLLEALERRGVYDFAFADDPLQDENVWHYDTLLAPNISGEDLDDE